MKPWFWLLMVVPMTALATERWVEVSGSAQASVQVDKVHLQSRVEEVAGDPVEAKRLVDEKVAALLTLFRNENISKEQVDAGSLRVMPEYQYEDRNRTLVGYRASRSIGLDLDAGESGQWIALLLQHGVTELDNPAYWASNAKEQQQQLLVKAYEDAWAKAGLMAKASGNSLGEVLSMSEQRGAMPRPMMVMERGAADSSYQPGGQAISTTITLKVALED
ncbi:Protein of unknown function [Ferrimonas sediminum]|uniref:DUF541 domain-containing protein n=1 Tax=Ferrimonas sediminum TaxID=718193 RepID=A0A1G9AFC9_9GAMM|nr:SIMPL domain-containing protein [Ferrimonas sediminum]SDK26082.1 Protein of unknown function [Ferrimonas sediminum]